MYEGPVQDLIDELGRLPGIGPKSAQRLAFHILAADPDDVRRLADILKVVKETVKFCEICFNVSEDTQCRICRDPRRDQTTICVVEEAKDVVAVERTASSAVAITSWAERSVPSMGLGRLISRSASYACGWRTAQ